MQVYDRNGNLMEVDGDVCPDGCSVQASVLLMDAEQRANRAAFADDGDDDQLTDEEAAEQRRERAYAAMKMRLDTAALARRQPKPQDPWSKWKPKRRKVVLSGSAGDADPNERARNAYAERSQRMADSWKQKSHRSGPYGVVPSQRPIGQPAWMRNGDKVPAVGPSGRSPYSSQHKDRGEQAYRRMVDSVSTRWKTHRKPAVPEAN
jgi:hypothetical protein